MEAQRSPFPRTNTGKNACATTNTGKNACATIILKLLPSFTDFAFLMPMALLFGRMNGAQALLGDCDTGWHIRGGEWIVANHQIPLHDVFSFSKPGGPWAAWSWLADVGYAWLNAAGGLRAVVLFSILLISAIFTLLYHLVRGQSSPIVAILVTVLAAGASSIHWLARPHLFTMLLAVLFYAALERFAELNQRVNPGQTRPAGIRYLAVLPAGIVLWANIHQGFFVGILTIAVFGVGEILQIVLLGDRNGSRAEGLRAGWLRARWYFGAAAAGLAASLINPYTYRLLRHVTSYLGAQANWQHVEEYLSPNFHGPTAVPLEAMLVLAAATIYWNFSKGRFTEPLLLLLWGHAALLAQRNIAIFAVIAAVPVGRSIQEWLDELPRWKVAGWVRTAGEKFNRLAASTGETEAAGRWHLASVFAVLLVAAVIWAPNPPKAFRAEFDPDRYPAGALATLRGDPSARIFTGDEWGDYLILSLYPSQKVFVDGRADFYGGDFYQRLNDVLNVKYDWEQTLGGYGVNTILLPVNAPLAGALKESTRWRVVFDDGVAVVFRSAGKAA